jgi:hypothetical protein
MKDSATKLYLNLPLNKLLLSIGYGVFLWYIAALIIQTWGSGFRDPQFRIVLMALTIPGILLSVLIAKFALKLPDAELLACVSTAVFTATFLDGIVFGWFPTFYATNMAEGASASSLILWGVAIALLFVYAITAKTVNFSLKQTLILIGCAITFWLSGVLSIKFLSVSENNIWLVGLFVLSFPTSYYMLILAAKLAGLNPDQLLGMGLLVIGVAIFLDSTVLTWLPSLYGDTTEVVYYGTDWLLWSVGAGALIAQYLNKKAIAV